MFTVYILYSTILDKFYIGYTSQNIEDRLAQHLCNHKGFTAKTKDWKFVYSESFNDKATAMCREKEIKNWKSKTMIKKLIDKYNTSSSAG